MCSGLDMLKLPIVLTALCLRPAPSSVPPMWSPAGCTESQVLVKSKCRVCPQPWVAQSGGDAEPVWELGNL